RPSRGARDQLADASLFDTERDSTYCADNSALSTVIRRILPRSKYARNVATLISGSAVAQAIPVAISPILTRIYTPEEFGIFATYLGIAAIASVLVTGRYELAIMLPERDEDAIQVAALSLLLTFVVSLFLLVVAIVFSEQIAHMLGSPAIRPWLYWVP